MKNWDKKLKKRIFFALCGATILLLIITIFTQSTLFAVLFALSAFALIAFTIILVVLKVLAYSKAHPKKITTKDHPNDMKMSTAFPFELADCTEHVYRVVGVTFKSGKYDRQDILRTIKKRKHTASLRPYFFEGEDAIGVYADEYHIGNIAKDNVSKVKKLLGKIVDIKINVYGGDSVYDEIKADYVDHNYGAEIVIFVKKGE